MELFEEIRREYAQGAGTVRAVAKKLAVHRRTVRQALASALPPERKIPARERPKLGPVKVFIDDILEADRKAPRKQRHTAHRIYVRICREMSGATVSETTVRRYVRWKKQQMGAGGGEVFVPQTYDFGQDGQVDWFEAWADIAGDRQKVYVFCLRSMASGGAYHRAYLHATQQAFLEAHELAFAYFGGVFRRLRFDNLAAAVRRILRGSQREETIRFLAFRSHWGFAAEFCTPGEGHEKGGVEGEGGFFRRNHLVPLPQVRDLAELNEKLLRWCREDEPRVIGGRSETAGALMLQERPHLLPLAKQGFDLGEVSFPTVDNKGCVRVRTNHYSTPLRPGLPAEVKLYSCYVEIWRDGKCVARHERCYGRRQHILDLEHYLEVLSRKPGALAGSTPLAQWRTQGRWKASHDSFWQILNHRHGRQNGTRAMIEVLALGQKYGYPRLEQVLEKALALGCSDVEAIRYLLTAETLERRLPESVDIQSLSCYERPLPTLVEYDQLLTMASATEVLQ